MKLREPLYALIAIGGLISTWHYNLQYLAQGGSASLLAFMRQGLVNPAATSLTLDLTIVFVVFAIWVFAEARRIGMRFSWVYPLLGTALAVSFAFPLFLYMRERHLRLHVVSAGGG